MIILVDISYGGVLNNLNNVIAGVGLRVEPQRAGGVRDDPQPDCHPDQELRHLPRARR